jgi:hypothetical protein
MEFGAGPACRLHARVRRHRAQTCFAPPQLELACLPQVEVQAVAADRHAGDRNEALVDQ